MFGGRHEHISLDLCNNAKHVYVAYILEAIFPSARGLRYRDDDDDIPFHVPFNEESHFVTPSGGWNAPGRVYVAICGEPTSTAGIFF